MLKNHHLKNLFDVLLHYKLFSLLLGLMLLILLLRIPFGTFNQPSLFDSIAHFVLPPVTGSLLFALLTRNHFFPVLSARTSLFIIVSIGVMIEVLWEIIEYSVDLTLQLEWQLGNTDTMDDLVLALIGSMIGGWLFLKLYNVGDNHNGGIVK